MENCFIPIAGANEIGASSYFLAVDNNYILLDCGCRIRGEEKLPYFNSLFKHELNDLNEINFVILSHAHYDHIGALPYISNQTYNNTTYISTKATRDIAKLQLIEMGRDIKANESECIRNRKRLITKDAIDRIRTVSYLKKQKFKDCTITLYPAGHMVGASMTYIQTKNYNILYTGDFSFENVSGINNIRIDESLKPDILILNATHGYKKYNVNINSYKELISDIKVQLQDGKNILLQSLSIPRQLDLFYMLNESKLKFTTYIDDDKEIIADTFEELGYIIYSKYIKGFNKNRKEPHILVSRKSFINNFDYNIINIDNYSLHANYLEIEKFIKMLKPKLVYIVHTNPIKARSNIIDEIKYDKSLNIEIIQCFNEEKYKF